MFHDRGDAGRQLAERLAHLSGEDVCVLALPRGGVPVAFEIAKQLDAPLELLVVRKIGAPGHEEFGVGAVVDAPEPEVVLNDAIVRELNISDDYLETAIRREVAEIARRRAAYVGDRDPLPVEGRTIIVVDDGIATGGTVRAALNALKRRKPGRLVLAVPVAPSQALEEIGRDGVEIVCLERPEPFYAVGLHYRDFAQTGDDEVVRLLEQAQAFGTRRG